MTKRKVINLAPTPEGYAYALLAIIENSRSQLDRAWAKSEIINAFKAAARLKPDAWGKEATK